MSGRCRSLATAVIGVLGGSVIQQAGFDLDPMMFEVADLIMMSTSSSNDILTLPSPTSEHGPSFTPIFLQNRLLTNIDLSSMFLIFLIACYIIAGIFTCFLRTRASKTAAMVTNKQTLINNAVTPLLQGFANLTIGHVRLWRDIHQSITDLQAAVRHNLKQHHRIIDRLHHQYQRLLRQVEAKSTEIMTEMWQCMQENERRITVLVNAARERSSELLSVKSELQAVHEAKQIIQDKLSDCEQQLGHAQHELKNNKNQNTIIRERLDGHSQTSRRLEEKLIKVNQERLAFSEIWQQKSKGFQAAAEGHKEERSRLAIELQAERDAKAQLQSKVKELDQCEARLRKELDNILNTNGSLHSEKKKVLAQNAALEGEKARLAEENATLQMENGYYVKANEELQNENASLAQLHQRSESAEQGSAASQPLPVNQDQAKDAKHTAPTSADNEKLPSTSTSPHNATASDDGAQRDSIDPTGEISSINAGSSSQDDDPTPSSVVSSSTNAAVLSGEGQPTDSHTRGRGTFILTQDVPSIRGGPLDWDHPPSPVTNRETDWGLDVGSHRPSTSASRRDKPSQGLYVPIHRRPTAEAIQSPGNEANDNSSSVADPSAKDASGTNNGDSNTDTYQKRQNRRHNKYRDKKRKALKETSKDGDTEAPANTHTF
ncbi:MAG: hypothetical protein Q9207_002790 [Kuettlingeria erythrocarpa]